MPRFKQSNVQLNKDILAAIRRLEAVKKGSVKSLIAELEKTRQLIVLSVAENGQITSQNVQSLKYTINQIIDTRGEQIRNALSENARRIFVKGIQVIDNALTSEGIRAAVPYLSETKLKVLQDYHAELITDITNDAKARISREITLSQLGQKSVDETVKAIGRNLTKPSIFKTVTKRAETIFKTEVNRIGNVASVERIKQYKKQVPNLQKTWLHSHVGIPRAGHLMLHGVTIPTEQPFKLFGGDGKVYYPNAPHDPILPAGETVNCKCMVVGKIIKEST